MKSETRVLQDRVEIAALEWRLRNADERIGRGQNEQMKRRRDPALDGERVGLERRGQIVAEDGDQRAEKRKDRHPQHHRTFVVPPDAGEPIDERHLRIGVLEHIEDGKIGNDVASGERGKGHCYKGKLRERRRRGHAH